MTTIIGYTDSITECECCGKVDLKGTYCLDIDGEEFYYGSVCAFKNHGITHEQQKEMKSTFTKAQKNAKLIEMHIAPLRNELQAKLAERVGFYNDNYTKEYNRVIELRAKILPVILMPLLVVTSAAQPESALLIYPLTGVQPDPAHP